MLEIIFLLNQQFDWWSHRTNYALSKNYFISANWTTEVLFDSVPVGRKINLWRNLQLKYQATINRDRKTRKIFSGGSSLTKRIHAEQWDRTKIYGRNSCRETAKLSLRNWSPPWQERSVEIRWKFSSWTYTPISYSEFDRTCSAPTSLANHTIK